MIAIVGMSSLFPEAKTVGKFWENILAQKDCIREIVDRDPREFDGFWRVDEYYASDPSAIDKTYGKTGGFVPEIEFDPIEFGIPPIHLESISTTQLFSLVLAKQALADAGYSRTSPNRYLNQEKTGVILGVGGCGNIAFTLATRTNIPQWEKVLQNLGFPNEIVQETLTKLKSLYAGWRESSFPGLLGNVVSGRITSYFDLGGTNCTLDAACASSLAAIKMAIAELADGSCDAVLTGGVNIDNSILAYMCFSKTPALSPEGFSRPFDATSDGIVLGDGIGMLVLKRLEDAQADGNKIYGVIRGMGSSSDGRAKSIYAPRFEGQIQALNRAYARAGVNPRQIQLVEAHGTGTIAGDLCEIKSISEVYQSENVPISSVALGSIKSQIGHTRIAAGAASLIKVTLGLYHKILPPTINVTKPHPQLALDNSCFYLNSEARPWIQPADGSKRRAAISAFGFGGTNFHMIVEEYAAEHQSAYRIHQLPEILIVRAENLTALRQTCQELLTKFSAAEGQNHYLHYCNSYRNTPIPAHVARLGFVSESLEQTIEYLQQAVILLSGDIPEAGQHPKGIYYRARGLNLEGKVVALFPGQGSQYLNMGRDWANNYPEIREVLAQFDRLFIAANRTLLSNIIYPPPVFAPEQLEQPKQELMKTENAQPAIGAISSGIYKLLQKAGFKPDFILGHSFGELTALWAAGVLSDEAFYQLAIERGKTMQLPSEKATMEGGMLAVNASEKELVKWISPFPDVTITNYNASTQTVLGGSKPSITSLQKQLNTVGIKATLLSVANAFHTNFVNYAAEPLAQKIFQTHFNQPSIPIYSNVTAQPYPQQPEEIKKILATHLLSPVAFRQSIEAIYHQGGRVFVEIGPKKVLTSFVDDILKNREYLAVAINPQSSKSQEYELRRAIVQLWVAGMEMEKFDPYQLPQPVEAIKAKPSLSIKLNGGFYLNPDTKECRQKSLVEKDTFVWDNFLKSYRDTLSLQSNSLSMNRESPLETAISSALPSQGSSLEGSAELVPFPSNISRHGDSQTRDLDTRETQGTPVAAVTLTENNLANHPEKIMQNSDLKSKTVLANAEIFDRPITNMTSFSDRIESQNFLSEMHQRFYQNQAQYLNLLSKVIDHQSLLLDQYQDLDALPQTIQNLDKILQLLQTNLGYANINHQHYLQSQLALLQGTVPIPSPLTQSLIPRTNNGANTPVAAAADEIDASSFIPQPTPPEVPIPTSPVNSLQSVVISSANNDSTLVTKKPSETVQENEQKTSETLLETAETLFTSPPPKPNSVEEIVSTNIIPPSSSPNASLVTTQAVNDVDVEAISTTLLKIVSEKTGYPAEMLDVNMDLEADMGIDSIKQVEIIGAMHEVYPEIELDADTLAETLGELRTLAQVIDYIKEVLATVSVNPSENLLPVDGITRQVVKKNS